MKVGLKHFLAAAALVGMGSMAHATLIFHEPFAGTPGNLVPTPANDETTENEWTESGSNVGFPIQVVANSLTYGGLEASTGGKIILQGGVADGQDAGYTVAAASAVSGAGNFAYYSCLATWTTVPASTSTGDYFFHVTDNAAAFNFRGRVFVKQGTAANTVNFGIRWGSNDTIVYDTTDYPMGDTHLLVAKISILAGDDNDAVALFVNPTPGGTEPTPTVSTTNSNANSGQDLLSTTPANDRSVNRVNVRQGGANMGTVEVDEIRFGTTWADVTPASANVGTWDLY